jgi:4'-phosphopantetheinyl transferase EntD
LIASLLPPGVIVEEARAEDWEAPLHPSEEEAVRHAVQKRRREFRAGRACARRALAGLGLDGVILPSGPDRLPAWPSGVVGSITHTEGYCAAAAALAASFRGLGIDAEQAMPLAPEVATMVCGKQDVYSSDDPLAPLIVFTAKEAFFKCVFPVLRTMLEFSDVACALAPRGGAFTTALRPPSPQAAVQPLQGRWCVRRGLVLAAVAWTNDADGLDGSDPLEPQHGLA